MSLVDIMIIIGIFILIVSWILLKKTKVPSQVYKSKSVYSDHKEKPIRALFSPKYRLAGKPDFILHTKYGLLPLEIKHSKKPSKPYFSHVMQLVSYCLLIEEERGEKPKYGFIQYKKGKPFVVPYTENRKSFLIKTMDEMRGYIDLGECPVNTYKCKNCREEKEL